MGRRIGTAPAQVKSRDAVRLAYVMIPLPEKICRGNQPNANSNGTADYPCQNDKRQVVNQEPVLPPVLFRARELCERRYDVMIAKKPKIGQKHIEEKGGMKVNHNSRNQRQRENAKYQRQIVSGRKKPTTFIPPGTENRFRHCKKPPP